MSTIKTYTLTSNVKSDLDDISSIVDTESEILSNYRFDGWTSSPQSKTILYRNASEVQLTQNTTLYGKWAKIDNVAEFGIYGFGISNSKTYQKFGSNTQFKVVKNGQTYKMGTVKTLSVQISKGSYKSVLGYKIGTQDKHVETHDTSSSLKQWTIEGINDKINVVSFIYKSSAASFTARQRGGNDQWENFFFKDAVIPSGIISTFHVKSAKIGHSGTVRSHMMEACLIYRDKNGNIHDIGNEFSKSGLSGSTSAVSIADFTLGDKANNITDTFEIGCRLKCPRGCTGITLTVQLELQSVEI